MTEQSRGRPDDVDNVPDFVDGESGKPDLEGDEFFNRPPLTDTEELALRGKHHKKIKKEIVAMLKDPRFDERELQKLMAREKLYNREFGLLQAKINEH